MLRRATVLSSKPRIYAFGPSKILRSLSSTGQAGAPIDLDVKLREDVKTLGKMLGTVIKSQNNDVYDMVENLRRMGADWRQPGGNKDLLKEMVDTVKSSDTKQLLGVSRAFTHFLALSNTAENHHRIRKLRERMEATQYGFVPKEDSCLGSILKLKNQMGLSSDQIMTALVSQTTEIVLTGA